MKKRRKKSRKAVSIAVKVLCAILAAALCLVVGFIVPFIVKNVTAKVEERNELYVVYGKNSVKDSESLGTVYSGAEIEVHGSTNYTVNIEAYFAEGGQELTYTVGEEGEYRYSSLAGRSLAKGFDIEKIGSGIKIGYDDLNGILTKVYGYPVTVSSEIPKEDLFLLKIVSGKETLSVSFTVNADSTLILDKSEIVF